MLRALSSTISYLVHGISYSNTPPSFSTLETVRPWGFRWILKGLLFYVLSLLHSFSSASTWTSRSATLHAYYGRTGYFLSAALLSLQRSRTFLTRRRAGCSPLSRLNRGSTLADLFAVNDLCGSPPFRPMVINGFNVAARPRPPPPPSF